MTEFIFDDGADEFEFPSPKEKGKIVVEVTSSCDNYGWAIKGKYHEGGGPFWVAEGIGIEYFVFMNQSEISEPGYWTFVGVHGEFSNGDGWEIDADEDWYFDECRRSTDDEVTELHG